MSSPLVSVIIPVYNGANFLREAIDSVLAQTFSDFELLVVDDGSQDETPVIARSYGNRLSYLPKPNGGVASALNLGISHSRGKYLAWLSHDDLFLPHKLERQVKFLADDPRFRGCYTDVLVVDQAGNVLHETKTPWYPRPQALRALFREMYINGSSMLFERVCLDRVGLFREDYLHTQDADMWLRMLKHFEIGRVPEALIKWRSHPQQGSRSRSAADRECQIMFRSAFEYLGIESIFPERAESSRTARTIAWGCEWFGDMMGHRCLFHLADEYYRRSVETWPSWINRARWKCWIGARYFFMPSRYYRKAVRDGSAWLARFRRRRSEPRGVSN